MVAKRIPVGVYELDRLVALLYSVEQLSAMARGMEGEWTPSDMGMAMDSLYWLSGAIGTVKPGTFAITSKAMNQNEIWAKTAQDLRTFIDKTSRSPGEGGTYMNGLLRQRAAAIAKIDGLTRASRQINAQVAREAQTAARKAADIQFTSALIGAGVTCALTMGGAGPSLAMGLGTSIGGSIIKDIASGNSPLPELSMSIQGVQNVLGVNTYKAVAIETTKFAMEKGISRKTQYGRASHHAAKMQEVVGQGEKQVKALQAKLAGEMRGRARKNAQRQLGKATMALNAARPTAAAAAAQAAALRKPAMTKAYGGSVALRGLPLVFFAFDVWDALGDLQNAYADTE